MGCVNNCVDREMTMRLLKHGVFLSERVKPISRPEALVLLAEAAVDDFVKEFKGIVKELLSGCQLSDLQATPIEMSKWFGEPPSPASTRKDVHENECPPEKGGTPSCSNICKEVEEKMKFDMQSKLDEYLRLLEQIKQKTGDERIAVALLQEVSKDRRSAEIREERESKNSEAGNSDTNSSQPATDKQKQFMKKLGIKFPATVTKQEASLMIDEELGKSTE